MSKPENKKVSTQFLNYLKNSPTPQSKPQSFKQKQPMIQKSHNHETYHGPIQGDFSKIGLTYVLENDQLRKKDAIYRKPGIIQVHNQKYDEVEELQDVPADVQLLKEITKLEFLEKKGYLKPEQVERLQCLKGMRKGSQYQEPIQIPEKRQIKNAPVKQMTPSQIPYEMDLQNMDPNMYYQDQYMSPKTKSGEPMYGYPQFNQPMHYNQPMNYPQKLQYFDQGHQMNYGPAMQSHQYDPRQNGNGYY